MKRILVCSTDMVLCAGVANLLNHEKDMEVIRINTENEIELLDAIEQCNPYAVIFYESILAADHQILISLFKDYPDVNVLTVSPDNNWVHAYLNKNILLTQASDLANIIRAY